MTLTSFRVGLGAGGHWPISGRSPIEILPHEHDTYNWLTGGHWPISRRSPITSMILTIFWVGLQGGGSLTDIRVLPNGDPSTRAWHLQFSELVYRGGSLTDIRALPNGDPSTRAWHLQFSELAYMRGGEHWPISEINSETYKCQPYCTYILSHIDIFATSQTWGINTLSFTYVSCMFWWAKLHFGIYICIMYVHKGGKMQR